MSALTNGANVTVITPYSENSSNHTILAALTAAGAHAEYEYTTAATPVPSATPTSNPTLTTFSHSPMDIHAKFALVDGVAYMDGHNWFTTDTVVKDTDASDLAALTADLNGSFATPAPSGDALTLFTTDKQVSLQAESTFLQNVALPAINSGAADEYDFITESFNPGNATGDYNDDVYIGMCDIASSARKPALHMVFESESGYSTAAQTAIQNLILLDPTGANLRTNNNGHEKISMIRKSGTALAAWFGSSNATTTDLFDWGMVTYNPALLTGLASYFDNVEFANATSITATGSTSACGTIHS